MCICDYHYEVRGPGLKKKHKHFLLPERKVNCIVSPSSLSLASAYLWICSIRGFFLLVMGSILGVETVYLSLVNYNCTSKYIYLYPFA